MGRTNILFCIFYHRNSIQQISHVPCCQMGCKTRAKRSDSLVNLVTKYDMISVAINLKTSLHLLILDVVDVSHSL